MDILAKIEEKKAGFAELQERLTKYNNAIAEIEKSKTEVQNEMLRFQGEYRILLQMGVEEGLLNENGEPFAAPEQNLTPVQVSDETL